MNDKQRNIGIAVAVLGLLLFCCLCPLALNSWLFIMTVSASPTNPVSLYGQLFSTRVGNLALSTYVVGIQNLCASVVALVVLVLGGVAFAQARKTS